MTTLPTDARDDLPAELIDQAVLLLVGGFPTERLEAWFTKAGYDSTMAQAVIRAARGRITVAADYVRDEKLGAAVMRMEDMFNKAMAEKPPDTKTALAAQKELNRLLNLYDAPPPMPGEDSGESQTANELRLIGSYLMPLNLIGKDLPVAEHARVAADLIRDAGLAADKL